MIQNIYKLQNNMWTEVDAFYPLKFSQKLNLEFDSGAFNAFVFGEQEIAPYTLVKVQVGDTNDDLTTLYYYTTPSEEWQPTEFNQQAFELVEVSKELQGVFLDGVASTNTTASTKSLLSVLTRLLAITPLRRNGQPQKYNVTTNEAVLERLTAKAPEFRWSAQTSLWEALTDIGACIDAIPRLTAESDTATVCNVITFDFVNTLGNSTEVDSYIGRLRSVDDEQYCSALETMAQNLVTSELQEGNVIVPAYNAFVSPRTNDVKITDQNCELMLPAPIIDVEKFEYDASDLYLRAVTFNANSDGTYTRANYNDVRLSDIGENTVLDLTSRLVERNKWQTLPTVAGGGAITALDGMYKESTLYFDRYSDTVFLQNGLVKGANDAFFSQATFGLVVNAAIKSTLKIWSGASNTTVDTLDLSKAYYIGNTPIWLYTINGLYTTSTIDLINAQFRLTYQPMNNNVKLRATKEKVPSYGYVMPYNQRAEINNSQPFGKNMQTTVNRLGVEMQTVVDFVTSWANAKKVGDNYNGFIVTAVDYNFIGADALECVYYLSKDWSYLSQWFAVDKKFRSWEIPAENTLRNLYYSDRLRVTRDGTKATSGKPVKNETCLTQAGFANLFEVLQRGFGLSQSVNNLFLTNLDADSRNVVTASSFAFGKSLVLHAEMADNLSAGIKRDSKDVLYNTDSFYANEDGTLMNATLTFSSGISSNASALLPEAMLSNMPLNEIVTLNNMYVDKDPAEKLAVTYQLLADIDDDSLILGDAFFSRNPLVRFRQTVATVEMYALTQPFEQASDNTLPAGAVSFSSLGLTHTVAVGEDMDTMAYARVQVPALASTYTGWALCEIVDGTPVVLIASNKNIGTTDGVYFYPEQDFGAGENAPDIQYVTITYKLASPQGKGNRVGTVKHRAGVPFSLADDYTSLVPRHFEVGLVTINGQTAGATFTPTTDTVINISLTFVPFDAYFKPSGGDVVLTGYNSNAGRYLAKTVAVLSTDGQATFKPGRYTWITFPNPSDGGGVIEDRNVSSLYSSFWQAVVYATPLYDIDSEFEACFFLISVYANADYVITIDGKAGTNSYTGTSRANALGYSKTCQYTITMQDGSLYLTVPALGTTIADPNGGLSEPPKDWTLGQAKFRISEIYQRVDDESQL